MGSGYDDYKDGVEDGFNFSYDKDRYKNDSQYAEGVKEGQSRYKTRSITHKPDKSEINNFDRNNYQSYPNKTDSEPSLTAWVVGAVIFIVLGYFTGPCIGALLYMAAGFCVLGIFWTILTKK